MMIIKSMIEPANPHLQCLLENNEEDYYFGISGGHTGRGGNKPHKKLEAL